MRNLALNFSKLQMGRKSAPDWTTTNMNKQSNKKSTPNLYSKMHLHNWPLHLWFLYSLIFWLNLIRHRMGHWAGSCIESFLFGSIALSRRLWEWEECGAMCRYRVLRQLFFGSAATWSKHTLHQIVLPAVICQRVYERIPALIREMSEGDGERERENTYLFPNNAWFLS